MRATLRRTAARNHTHRKDRWGVGPAGQVARSDHDSYHPASPGRGASSAPPSSTWRTAPDVVVLVGADADSMLIALTADSSTEWLLLRTMHQHGPARGDEEAPRPIDGCSRECGIVRSVTPERIGFDTFAWQRRRWPGKMQ